MTTVRKIADALAPTKERVHLDERKYMFGSSKGPWGAVQRISQEKSRTILAVVAASVISLVVWGLVVALNIR